MPVQEHLAELVRGLDAGWKQLAERLEEAGPEAKVSIEVQDDGRVKLNVDKLGALGEPKSLTWLRKRVEKMLPKIDLPDLLFEVNAWTGFLDAFVHLGDGTTRMKDLPCPPRWSRCWCPRRATSAWPRWSNPPTRPSRGPGSCTSTSTTCALTPSPRRTRGSSAPRPASRS